MLSVCIPVYNRDVRPLVATLQHQAGNANEEVEIIVIDDHSEERYHIDNLILAQDVTYIRLDENIGRSRIRNLFRQYARGRYLLFLDCDVTITNDTFLQNYIDAYNACGKSDIVINGGKVYLPTDNPRCRLKMHYAQRCECLPVSLRAQHPYRSFITTNFLISRSAFDLVQFDETLHGYGHEDTLFGYRLRQQGVTIRHVGNPVTVADVDDDETFMVKTEESIGTLAVIYFDILKRDKSFAADVRLLASYELLSRFCLVRPMRLLFRPMRRRLRHILTHGVANIWMFNFYKLGLLLSHSN